MRKFTSVKVSLEFNNALSAHSLFQGDDYKLISPCHYLLNRVHGDCIFKKCEYAPIHSKWIQDLFQAYTTSYRPVIDALLELDLLKIRLNQDGEESYCHGQEESESFTKSYKVTPKCAEMLASANKEWLRKLHNDPQTRRLVKKTKAQRIRRFKPTGDLVVDSTAINLLSLKYNTEDANALLAATNEKDRANNIVYSLINIETGDFSVKRHKDTGRIYNPWNLMNSQLRPIFFIRHGDKKLFNSHIIDLRAAHPCFWAIYVKNYYYSTNIYNKSSVLSNTTTSLTSPSSLSTSPPYYSHYVTLDEAFLAEVDKWNALWTHRTVDPRDVIAAELDTTKEHVKSLLNTAINDGRNANKLHLWIKTNFPHLHAAWQKLGIDETGVNISRLYESRLNHMNETRTKSFHQKIVNSKSLPFFPVELVEALAE